MREGLSLPSPDLPLGLFPFLFYLHGKTHQRVMQHPKGGQFMDDNLVRMGGEWCGEGQSCGQFAISPPQLGHQSRGGVRACVRDEREEAPSSRSYGMPENSFTFACLLEWELSFWASHHYIIIPPSHPYTYTTHQRLLFDPACYSCMYM